MLKRLELQGFKSFAEKTVLEFPSAITAVVGPNGSGKSNIVDAIRWVFGEQSLKNLRSVRSEDVIFSGNAKKAAPAFASVALHFDNKNKIFPLDYAEVTIGRKLYRDGTSEYLLNKADVRLKDIVQILAGARLGNRGLAVIGQGAGDVFLRASPLERREMMEEVIGLKEFRMKKEEAERKLEETAVNIEKVSSLLAEIEPHLRSLRRQASRWEKRQEKETLLKQLEETYFRLKLAEVERIGEGFLGEKGKVRAEIEALEKEIKQLEDEFSRREAALSGSSAALRELDFQMRSLEEGRANALRELGKIEGRIEAISAQTVKGKTLPYPAVLEKLKFVKDRLGHLAAIEEFEALREGIRTLVNDLEVFFAEPPKPVVASEVLAEKEKLLKSLEDFEARLKELAARKDALGRQDEGAASGARELLAQLESKRALAREKASLEAEYRFEEEKRHLHEKELRLRMKEAGWDFDEFAKNWSGKEVASSGTSLEDLEVKIMRLRRELADIGAVDEETLREFQETEARAQFLISQKADLDKAREDLENLAGDLEKKIAGDFGRVLKDISEQFSRYFQTIFGGGTAKVYEEKIKSDDPALKPPGRSIAGVEIAVDLPRKKIKSIDALSGGERALTSIALIFAVVGTSSPPFLVLDEIDAPLDEANSQRFARLLKELASRTQFILITHNRATMEAADILYGVTIEDGVSKLFSLKFEEAQKVASKDMHASA